GRLHRAGAAVARVIEHGGDAVLRRVLVPGEAAGRAEINADHYVADEMVVRVAPGVVLFDERQDLVAPTPVLLGGDARAVGVYPGAGTGVRVPVFAAVGEHAVGVVVSVKGEADLLEVVGALDAVGRLADLLHGRQQQRDQHADDGDHHQ